MTAGAMPSRVTAKRLRHGVCWAAIITAGLQAAPAFAAGGHGVTIGNVLGGNGGVDGSTAQATGQSGATIASSSEGSGAGAGAVDLTTGNGGAGGARGLGTSTNGVGARLGNAGTTGSAGEVIDSAQTISSAIAGGTGGHGEASVNSVGGAGGNSTGGGGGGGVGVSATADVTVDSTGSVTGGGGASSSDSVGAGGGAVGIFSSASVSVDAGGQVKGGAGGGPSGAPFSVSGGGGGMGIVITSGGSVTNAGTIVGGAGGTSGTLTGAGGGGDGGAGILMKSGGTITNTGSISGGAGGASRIGPNNPGGVGLGGVGVSGENVVLINAGSIAGALSGTASGTTPARAAAVQFTGGVNSIEIQAGSNITGNVIAFSTNDTFKLGGTSTATDGSTSFDVSTIGDTAQYQGFGSFEKVGSGTWTLTKTTTALTPWTLLDGTLAISDDASLGDTNGVLTFNGGTLEATADITSSRSIALTGNGTIQTDPRTALTAEGVISGAGDLTKTGSGTLSLEVANTYTGATIIDAGILKLTGAGSIAASSGVVDNAEFNVATTASASIKTLSGDGSVRLDQTLILTDASGTFSGVILGLGGLTLADGTEVLSGNNLYSGATLVQGGTLRAGAAQTFGQFSNTTVAAGGTLDANGFAQTVASLSNAGTVQTDGAGTTAGTVLTVSGNYVGQGGTLVLNARLGDAKPTTDMLAVGGSATGTTTLLINNIGGGGAKTDGDGVEVVSVGGTSDPGAFRLGAAVPGGAFDYGLHLGGVGEDAGNQNWYLRSTGQASPAAQGVTPYADLLVNLAYDTIGTYDQRTGNRIAASGHAAIAADLPTDQAVRLAPVVYGQGAWGRIVGQYGSYEPSKGNAYTQSLGFLQAGYEGTGLEGAAGDLKFGLYGTVGTSRADIDLTADPVTGAARGKAHITTTGYGVGGNVTWVGFNGFYADLVGQVTGYTSDLGTARSDNQGWSTALSLEAGQRFDLGSGWAIAPQAQLAWTHVDFDSFTDDLGNAVSLGRGDSLRGRAGVRVENLSQWQGAEGRKQAVSFYGVANLKYEFLDGMKVDVDGAGLVQQEKRLWGEGGLGARYAWNEQWSVHGEADYSHALASGDNYDVSGTVGVSYKW